jgi:hypothetical protein
MGKIPDCRASRVIREAVGGSCLRARRADAATDNRCAPESATALVRGPADECDAKRRRARSRTTALRAPSGKQRGGSCTQARRADATTDNPCSPESATALVRGPAGKCGAERRRARSRTVALRASSGKQWGTVAFGRGERTQPLTIPAPRKARQRLSGVLLVSVVQDADGQDPGLPRSARHPGSSGGTVVLRRGERTQPLTIPAPRRARQCLSGVLPANVVQNADGQDPGLPRSARHPGSRGRTVALG